LVRVDYNVSLKEGRNGLVVADDERIRLSLPTLQFLLEAGARVILLSHLGRPKKEFDPQFSLLPIAQKLNELAFGLIGYKKKVLFSPRTIGDLAKNRAKELEKGQMLLLENLRFYSGEEENKLIFTKRLAKLGNFYINDAFSASHRGHASIVGLPSLLPSAAGLTLEKEVDSLTRLTNNPDRPLVLVVGGIKEDKLEFASQMLDWADQILLGGLLPEKLAAYPEMLKNKKVFPGRLAANRQDLDEKTIADFQEKIVRAKTVVLAGPVGNINGITTRELGFCLRPLSPQGVLLLPAAAILKRH